MQTTAHYHDDPREADLRLEVMHRIADCAFAMKDARRAPADVALAMRARILEDLLIQVADVLWPKKAFRSFEDVVLAYEGSLQ